MLQAEVYQTSCFETIIQRLDTNSQIILASSPFLLSDTTTVSIILSYLLISSSSSFYHLPLAELQFGVRILIILSIVLVAAVIVYAVIYRVIKVRTLRKNKELSSTTNLMQEPPVRR